MEKKKKILSKQNLVALFIVFIMVFSIGGVIVSNISEDGEKYKDYKFYRKGADWSLRLDKQELLFTYFPSEVEDMAISDGINERIKNAKVIESTSDVNSSYAGAIALAQFSLQDVLGLTSKAYIRVGMTEENEFELPVITCKDATSLVPVLYFVKSNETRIYSEGECIIGEARFEADLLKIKDRLLYGIIGVI